MVGRRQEIINPVMKSIILEKALWDRIDEKRGQLTTNKFIRYTLYQALHDNTGVCGIELGVAKKRVKELEKEVENLKIKGKEGKAKFSMMSETNRKRFSELLAQDTEYASNFKPDSQGFIKDWKEAVSGFPHKYKMECGIILTSAELIHLIENNPAFKMPTNEPERRYGFKYSELKSTKPNENTIKILQ